MTRRRVIGLAALAGTLFAAWMLVMPHSPGGLRALVAEAGLLGPLAMLAVWVVATPSLVSGTLLAMASGLLFGPVAGSALSIAGATLGGAVAFTLARRLGGQPARASADRGRFERLRHAVERNGFRSVLCLRAAPGVPATILNYAAGLARIRLRDFAAASLIGGAPRGFAYAVLGSSAGHPSAAAAILPVAVLIVMGVVGAPLAASLLRQSKPAPATA